jgi:ribosomal protein S18 acetylase RimI-like enzyme
MDGNIIGTFHLTIIPSMPLIGAKRGKIESVHIDGEYRGNGYGTQMMQYAINFAKEKGVKICQLTTNKKRIDAKRFYESLGFIATHEGMKLVL